MRPFSPFIPGSSFSGRRLSWSGFTLGCCAFLFCLCAGSALGDTVLASKHDLSAAGPGTIKAYAEAEVCTFCHTPHRGTGELPLWNHGLSTATYTPYNSSTTRATIGQP